VLPIGEGPASTDAAFYRRPVPPRWRAHCSAHLFLRQLIWFFLTLPAHDFLHCCPRPARHTARTMPAQTVPMAFNTGHTAVLVGGHASGALRAGAAPARGAAARRGGGAGGDGGLYADVSAHKHTAEVRFRGAVSLHAPVRAWPATRVQAPDQPALSPRGLQGRRLRTVLPVAGPTPGWVHRRATFPYPSIRPSPGRAAESGVTGAGRYTETETCRRPAIARPGPFF